jgi:2-iminobutanoate/2-iminopropanoate deaminase
MKIHKSSSAPDPYKPFRLAQGYRVGGMLYISAQAAINESGQIVAAMTSLRKATRLCKS